MLLKVNFRAFEDREDRNLITHPSHCRNGTDGCHICLRKTPGRPGMLVTFEEKRAFHRVLPTVEGFWFTVVEKDAQCERFLIFRIIYGHKIMTEKII